MWLAKRRTRTDQRLTREQSVKDNYVGLELSPTSDNNDGLYRVTEFHIVLDKKQIIG